MSDATIFLLTPQHTGTHFARMLCETHPHIAFCIAESRRVDCERREGYRLRDHGDGPNGAPNERMLDEYLVAYARGAIRKDELLSYVRSCGASYSEASGRRTINEELERISRKDFRQLGMTIPNKSPTYLLLHGHCGPKYQNIRFDTTAFKFVVTLRHPLLSVISALRRTNNPAVAHDLLIGFDLVLNLRNAFFVCVDLWQHQPNKVLNLFSFLNLEIEPASQRYLDLQPRINETVVRHDEPLTSLKEGESQSASEEQLRELRAAREMFVAERGIRPSMAVWWKRINELRLPERLRPLGYES